MQSFHCPHHEDIGEVEVQLRSFLTALDGG